MPFGGTSAVNFGVPGVDYPAGKGFGPCIKAYECAGACPNSHRWDSLKVSFSVTNLGHTITGGPYAITPVRLQCGLTGTHLDGSHFCPRPPGRKCCRCVCHYFLNQRNLPGDPDTQACVDVYPSVSDWPATDQTGADDGDTGHILLPEGISFNTVPGPVLGGCNPAGGGAENTARTTCQLVVDLAITNSTGSGSPRYGGFAFGPDSGLLSGPLDCTTFKCAGSNALSAKFTPLRWQPSFPGDPDLDGYILVESDPPGVGVKDPDTSDCPELDQGELDDDSSSGGGGGEAEPEIPWYGVGKFLSMDLMGMGMGMEPGRNCGCSTMARRMNMWGPVACRRQRRYLEHYLRSQIDMVGWRERIPAGLRAAVMGRFLKPWDPAPQLLERAIRRAERAAAG